MTTTLRHVTCFQRGTALPGGEEEQYHQPNSTRSKNRAAARTRRFFALLALLFLTAAPLRASRGKVELKLKLPDRICASNAASRGRYGRPRV
jgi:hypothetical protein